MPIPRILALSDKVLESHYRLDIRDRYPDVDLLVGCGDLPYYYLDFLASAFNKPMVYVLGNHDSGRQYSAKRGELTTVRGGQNVHARCVYEQGLLIAGLEGSMRYKPNRSQQYSESEMRRIIWSMFPQLLLNRVRYGRYLDLLITHSPPFGIHDKADVTHRGFQSFLTMMRLFRPKYLLHGHIHSATPQKTQYHQTTVMNIYPSTYFQYSVLDTLDS